MGKNYKLLFVTFLTMVRFPMVLLFVAGALVYTKYPSTLLFWASLGSLILAAVTDWFDGYFARKLDVVTKFGAHADPLMDKLFYICAMPLLVFVTTQNGNIKHAAVILIMTILFLVRDQWVTFLRSIGSIYNVSGKANWAGKLRTGLNFPVICCIYHFEEASASFINAKLLYTFEGIAFVINLITLYTYTRKYWPYLRKSAQDN